MDRIDLASIMMRLAYEIQAELLMEINSVDESHKEVYKAVNKFDVIPVVRRILRSL